MSPLEPPALPARRLKITTTFEWGGRAWLLDVGFDRAGRCREVFATGIKPGQAWQRTVSNTCILVSFLLQDAGGTLADLRRRLAPTEADNDRAAVPCFIETMLAEAHKVEAESQQAIREAYECCEGKDPWREHARKRGLLVGAHGASFDSPASRPAQDKGLGT